MKKQYLLYPFGLIATVSFPLVFLWMNNFHLINDHQRIWFTFAGLIACSALVCLVIFAFTKDAPRAYLCTTLLILIFENGALLQNFLTLVVPRFRYWHTATILIVLAGTLIYLTKKLSSETTNTISLMLCCIFSVLVIFNVVMAIPKMVTAAQKKNQIATEQELTAQAPETSDIEGRNIYWLLFDEYSSNYVFEKYADYDNSDFTDYLESIGFNISYTSYNESDKTVVVTANIANLDYVAAYNNERTATEEWELIVEAQESAVIIPMVESYGYSVVGIGHADFYGFKGETVSSSKTGLTVEGDDVVDLFWKKTLLQPFMGINIGNEAAEVMQQLAYLQDPNNIPESHTFVIAHFNTPHTPFLFAADGTPLPSSAYNKREFYVGQCQYVNSQIEIIVENIIANDPNAIIMLMSDHSRRGGVTYDDRRNILAAIYVGGEDVDIEGFSGMNIMILALNEALGTDIEYVEPIVLEEVTTK